jgi:hypothetical protein
MPKTLITSTGPNFIEKEDSPSDGLGFFSQVQHYEKQLGINGITGNTIFTLTKPYVVDSDTLMVFVNGQKAEKVASPSNELQYEETDLLRVTFGASLDDADVVEFSILGTYEILDTTQLFMPPGFVFPVVNSNTPPAGTLACEGAYVSKTTYSALFSGYPLSLGTYYGDGGSTFRLPDYRGRFLRGRANGSGRDPDRNSRISSPAGSPAGDNVGSYQADEFKSHSHSPPIHWLVYTGGCCVGPGDKATTFFSTNATGGSETRPKNTYVLWCIKY